MTPAGQKKVLRKIGILVFCLLCATEVLHLAGFFSHPCQAAEGIAPARTISVVSEPTTPEWKIIWDRARSLARRESYAQAASLYGQLQFLKPNIEEAAWEYCKVLLKLEDFATVRRLLSSLLEKNPGRIEYIFARAQLAAHEKDWSLAAKYYGRVLENDPSGKLADAALEGLAISLQAQGKIAAAFTLFERLIVRERNRADLLQASALAAQRLGAMEKARKLYERLLAQTKVDDDVLIAAATAFDAPEYESISSSIWVEYLKRHPDFLPFRRKLADFYVREGKYEEAIEHISYLAEKSDKKDEYMLRAGTINFLQLRRPDRALAFFERYLAIHPEEESVKRQIEEIQGVLANELLSIAENERAELLWQDLVKVTAKREAIYLKMADMLEKKGLEKPLLEVLTILHKNSPDDDRLSWRIACHYHRSQQYRQALDFLQKIRLQEIKNKEYYVLRSRTEETLGLEMAALNSLEEAMMLDLGDKKVRKNSLILAGKLGLAGRMEKIFERAVEHDGKRFDADLLLTYLDQLSKNYLFKRYAQVSGMYAASVMDDGSLVDRLDLMKAHSLRREGNNRSAEQLLRRMLIEERSVADVLFTLVDNAIADRNKNAADIWLKTLLQRFGGQHNGFSQDLEGLRLLLRKVRILKISGEYEQARELVTDYLAQGQQWKIPTLSLEELEKELCWLNYYMGEYEEALKTAHHLAGTREFDPELYILSRLLTRKKQKIASTLEKELEARLVLHDTPSVTRLVEVIELELKYEQYGLVEQHMQAVSKLCPESVFGNFLAARYSLAKGQFEDAVELLQRAMETYPEESYFTKKLIEVEVKRGRYDRAMNWFLSWKKAADIESLLAGGSTLEDIEETLLLARLLWGNKQQEKALRIYERLLAPAVIDVLQDQFARLQIDYLYLNREKSFWNSMMLMLQSEPELIAELMEPEFLVNNLNSAAAGIVASHYELYSWQKMISSEYLARKAIFERNYSSAEQNYRRLLDEEKTAEGMIDLAAVYGRTGKYRKEAQIYEAIHNSGATSPELANSLERSSIQMSPQNIFDIGYMEREGRDGFIDLAKTSIGTSFQFTPGLNKDIRFSYTNNRYESIDSSESAGSNMLHGSIVYEFANDFEFILGGGTEKLDGSSDVRFLYETAVKGQLDQYFNAYLAWQKDYIYDTVAAIHEDISSQGIETGLTCETPFGISLGGDFRHRNYSGGNLQNKFHGFSSYALYGDNINLSLRYDYQYLTNSDANPNDTTSDEDILDGVFYWSPDSFSEHLVTLHYQHDFLGYQQGKKQGVSYYSIENAVGTEADGFVSFTGRFNIFLEMNPHFLLKGNFTFGKSDDYEEKGISLSLHYRW